MQSGNFNTGNYQYNAPNINTPSVGGQTVNGINNVGGYQMPDYTGIAQTNNQNQQNFNTGQQNQVGAFQGAMQSSVNALPTYQQLNQQANEQYNVEPLARNAANLQATLLQVPQTYSQGTQGSDTNNNQLMQLIGQKQWELSPQANAATQEAQAAQGLANNMVGYGVQNENFQISPYTTAAPLVQNQMASAATNFGQEQANELQALESAVQAGTQLSGEQMAQLASLQNAKTAYDQAVKVANIGQQTALQTQRLTNQFQNIPAGNTLINTANGSAYRAR